MLSTWSYLSEWLEKYQRLIYIYIAKRKSALLNAGSRKTSPAPCLGHLDYYGLGRFLTRVESPKDNFRSPINQPNAGPVAVAETCLKNF